jgi:hypothetical protein
MWAACGGDQAFYTVHILPGLLTNPENKEEDMEAKLASFMTARRRFRISAGGGVWV